MSARDKFESEYTLCQEGDTSSAVAGTGDALGHRDSVRRVLALVGGSAQPHVLLRVRGDLALDVGHLHSLVVARVLVEEDFGELFVVLRWDCA